MLSDYRVLDLTDERGHLAGFILGQLGAEVIAIEPPGGSSARRLGPFAGDVEDPERSLAHWAYNRGKKSVVLDLDAEADRERLRALVRGADVLIESAEPGSMQARGLGVAALAELNPALIHVSITAFGSDGMAAHRFHLGDQGDLQPGVGGTGGDGGAQAGTAPSHHHDVTVDGFHRAPCAGFRRRSIGPAPRMRPSWYW